MDAQLDQLNSVLDSLEEKTDSIQQRAKDLLKSNRELRGGNNAQEAMDQDQPPDESDWNMVNDVNEDQHQLGVWLKLSPQLEFSQFITWLQIFQLFDYLLALMKWHFRKIVIIKENRLEII